MRIALTSDTHIGLTSPKTLDKMFRKMAEEGPHLLVHAGDYCGGRVGYRSVRSTCALMRKYLPNIPILSVLGNHDYWGATSEAKLEANIKKISDTFAEHNVHWLDHDGAYILYDYIFAGHTGWYDNVLVDSYTNDRNFMLDTIEGKPLHLAMNHNATREIDENIREYLAHASTKANPKGVWISHFPIINPDEIFGGSSTQGRVLQSLGFSLFLEGHSHQKLKGPTVFNCGAHYGEPRYIIMDI